MEPDDVGSFSESFSSGNRKKQVSSGGSGNNTKLNIPSTGGSASSNNKDVGVPSTGNSDTVSNQDAGIPSTSNSVTASSSSSSSTTSNTISNTISNTTSASTGAAARSSYNLGVGKNRPFGIDEDDDSFTEGPNDVTQHWIAPRPVEKPEMSPSEVAAAAAEAVSSVKSLKAETGAFVKKRKMVARDQASQQLRGAIWDEEHYGNRASEESTVTPAVDTTDMKPMPSGRTSSSPNGIQRPKLFYPEIDMSISSQVYNETYDAVWELLQWEAYEEAQREPLLVSFLYSTILNHRSLESSLAFLLANRLSSPMLISTQLQSFILEALDSSPEFRRAVRADMLAVRDRDPACTCLPDVFLYFKGFQALQSHRVAHCLWKSEKNVLAHFLQSQVSQIFQIDIHPNATLGEGIMLDHGTGIVMGETAMVGNNCSILHHVTLGGSGKKGVDRHPKVKDGVLLGAGATVLGNVVIGEGCQVGAGTLVISDLPPHSVAVGVPAKIIGSFIDVTEQPSNEMNQMIGDNLKIATFESYGI